jgi:hypothetical protein
MFSVKYKVAKGNAEAVRAHIDTFVTEASRPSAVGELYELMAKYSKYVDVMVREFLEFASPDCEIFSASTGKHYFANIVSDGLRVEAEGTSLPESTAIALKIELDYGMTVDQIEGALIQSAKDLSTTEGVLLASLISALQ